MPYTEEQIDILLARQTAKMLVEQIREERPTEPRPAASWGLTGRSEMPDERRHHPRDHGADRSIDGGEIKLMKVGGKYVLTQRLAVRDRDGQLITGYSDRTDPGSAWAPARGRPSGT